MADKKEEKQAGKKEPEKEAVGTGKPAAKKTATKKAKKPSGEAKPAKKAEEMPTVEEEIKAAHREEESPSEKDKGPAATAAEEKPESQAAEERPPRKEREEELSDEELRRLVEESLEKVTVEDIVLNMMGQLASVGYLKMGLPENVNLKYRDLDQAQLAIDTLEAMLKGAEGKVGAETLKPFQGTLANLQMNYVQLKARAGRA